MTEKKKPYDQLLKRWLKSPWPVVMALLFIMIYFTLGEIIKLVLPYTKYYYVPGFVAEPAANYIRPEISWPLADFVDIKGTGRILVVPYYLVVGYLITLLHLLLKPFYKYMLLTATVVLIFLRIFPGTLLLFDSSQPSISYGSTSNGSIEHSRRLAYKKHNYITYSFAGFLAGRTYVHENLRTALYDCYDVLDDKFADRTFVIGETGARQGGPISFHKEKQNGLQVDFMIPLLEDGKPYSGLNVTNYWNYGMEFGEDGTLDGMSVDYAAMASHLATLQASCLKNGLTIKRIEMNPALKKGLLGKDVANLLKNIVGKNALKSGKTYPAYYTVTFEIPNGKGRKLINKVLEGLKWWKSEE